MTEAKQQFVKKYIKELTNAINDYLSFDPSSQADNKLAENMLADTIIETVNVFSHELPKIGDGVLLRGNSILRDAKSVLGILELYLLENESTEEKGGLKSSNTGLQPKIFISHRSTDKKVAEILESFFTSCGISYENIFCSSLPGNDVKEKISAEVREALKNSVVNIAILSRDYYQSTYCLNEAGVLWYREEIPVILVALPEINADNMLGFLNNEYKLRFLDNEYDISYIYDKACEALSISRGKIEVISYETQKLKERYQNYLKSRPEAPCEQSVIDILSEITTDDERIILYYILSRKSRKLTKEDVLKWLQEKEVFHINIDNAFDLLSTLGVGKVSNDILELDINVFRKLSTNAEMVITQLKPCLERYIRLSSDKFQELWRSDDLPEYIKLFVAYIIEKRMGSFGARWMEAMQIEDIIEWERENALNSELSDNYSRCLEFFIRNSLVKESSWTSYGNPREYTLLPSLQELLFKHGELYAEDLKKVKETHRCSLY